MVEKDEKIEGVKKDVEKIFEDIHKRVHKSASFSIQRIDLASFEWFKKKAEDNFCGDYGMLLKMLIDTYKGLFPTGHEELFTVLEEHEQRLNILEKAIGSIETKEDESGIKCLSGRRIR